MDLKSDENPNSYQDKAAISLSQENLESLKMLMSGGTDILNKVSLDKVVGMVAIIICTGILEIWTSLSNL